MGNLGWIAAFVYVAGAALRLARFNVMLDVADKRWFTGIPSPAAAALVAGFVWIIDDLSVDPVGIRWWAWAVTLFAGLTMVSNVPYYSFKTINLKKSVPFLAIFVFVLVIALLAVAPALVLFAGFVGYALSGYVASAWMWYGAVAGARERCRRPTNPLRTFLFCGYSRLVMKQLPISGRPRSSPTRPLGTPDMHPPGTRDTPPFWAACCFCCAPRADNFPLPFRSARAVQARTAPCRIEVLVTRNS
jgi:hypothetical protein